jgi:hypothetical protein
LGRFAGYEVLEIAGSGGMGVVLKAHDRTLDRVVAIKVLYPDEFGERTDLFATRFLKEARALAALQHDHIATVYQAGQAKGLAYLVMPFYAGGSLDRLLVDGAKLASLAVARIGRQLADALTATHARGILHRDLKPSNVLLEDGVERVRLADFGLARTTDGGTAIEAPKNREEAAAAMRRRSRLARTVAGTPHYMAPEQAAGELVDARSDLFSLGALLFHLAAGRPIYPGRSAGETMAAARRAEVPSLRSVVPDFPADLAAIIDRLLAPRPEDRYATAAEATEAFDDYLSAYNRPHSRRRWVTAAVVGAVIMAVAIAVALERTGRTAIINTLLCWRTGGTYYIRGHWGSYQRLADVVTAARSGDLIEARFSHEELVNSFRLRGKSLRIRAVPGYTPTWIATNNAQSMILVDAPLALEGFSLWRRGTRGNFSGLISVESAPLHLLNCRIMRSRFAGQGVIIQGRLRSTPVLTGEASNYRSLVALQGSTGYLRHCVVVGIQASLFGLRASPADPSGAIVSDSLLAIDHTFFLRPDGLTTVNLRLNRSAVMTRALVDLEEGASPFGLNVGLNDCLVDFSQGALLRVAQSLDDKLWPGLAWRETNVVYAGEGAFAVSRRRQQIEAVEEWNARTGLTTNQHRRVARAMLPETCVRSAPRLQVVDLDPEVVAPAPGGQGEKATRENSGAFVGLPTAFVGEGEPYARFRRTRAYEEWQRAVEVSFREWEQKQRR